MTLGDLIARVGADISGFTSAMSDVNTQLKNASKEADKSFAGFGAAFQQLQTVGLGLSAAVTAPMVGLGAAAVSMSEQINLARLSFTTLLGSAEEAGKFLEQLKQFAASTPFEFPDLVQGARRMMAMGFEASQVIPMLRTIGDAVAGLGGNAQNIDRITLALGQMQAKGKVSAQEMNQLAENGIPAWKLLADTIGMSIPEAMKTAEKGAISASVAIPAIIEGMNEKFAGQMSKVSQTLTGVWSNFKDQASFVLGDIGNTLTPILKDLVTNVALPFLTWVKDITGWFAQLDPTLQKIILGFAALVAAIGPLMLVIGTMGQAWIGIQTAITVVTPLVTALGTALAGISLVTVGVVAAIATVTAGLVALGVWVANNWDAIIATLSFAWDAVKEIWTAFADWITGTWVGMAFGALIDVITGPFKDIYHLFADNWDAIEGVTVKVWKGISGFLSDVWKGLHATAQKVWDGIAEVIEGFIAVAKKVPGVKKLFELDDVWNANKKAADAAKVAVAQQTVELDRHGAATVSVTAKTKVHASATKESADQLRYLKFSTDEAKSAGDHHLTMFNMLNGAMIQNVNNLAALEEGNKILASTYTVLGSETLPTLENALKKIPEAMKQIHDASMKAITGVQDAFATLGLTSDSVLRKKADDAVQAYETIAASGTATSEEIRRAYEAMGEAVNRVNRDITGSMEVEAKKQAGSARSVMNQVSTIFTDAGRDIAKGIFGIFSGEGGSSKFNEDIAKQISQLEERASQEQAALRREEEGLRTSLAKRAMDYEEYVAEVDARLAKLRGSASDGLAEDERKLRQSLEKRADEYAEYEKDVLQRIGDLREKHEEQVNKERRRLEESLEDRTTDYRDYTQDIRTKIERLEGRYRTSVDDERKDLERSLRDKKRDYDRYVADVNAKIATLRASGKANAAGEIADLQLGLQRKTEDYNTYVSDQQTAFKDFQAKQREAMERDIADARLHLDRKTRDYQDYVSDNQRQVTEMESAHAAALAKEEGDLNASLGKKKADLEQYTIDATAEFERVKAANAAKLLEQENELKAKLATAKLEWQAYATEANAKLADIKIKGDALAADLVQQVKDLKGDLKTPWDDVKDLGLNALKSIGEAVARLFIEPATKAISNFISGVLTDLLSGKGFGGVLDGLKSIGSAVADIFGGSSAAGSAAGAAGSAAGSAGGAAGSAGSAVGSGISGIVGAVGSVVSAVSGIIGNFQFMGMNKSLDIIVLHTLQTANDLANLRRDEWDRHGMLFQKLDDMWRSIIDVSATIATGVYEKLDWITDGARLAVDRLDTLNASVLTIPEAVRQASRPEVNIYVSGARDPVATGQEVLRQLNAQLSYS